MKRAFDILAAFVLLCMLGVPMFVIALIVKLNSRGPVLYWSERVGRNNTLFMMPKFRTMQTNTPAVATHLLSDPGRYLTSVGRVMRRSSLDELPQLFCILKGDMTFVGPRPALYNQDDLIRLRTEKGIHLLSPGMTGWAQVNGRDELSIPAKVELDRYYMENRSMILDMRIMWKTLFKVAKSEGVSH